MLTGYNRQYLPDPSAGSKCQLKERQRNKHFVKQVYKNCSDQFKNWDGGGGPENEWLWK